MLCFFHLLQQTLYLISLKWDKHHQLMEALDLLFITSPLGSKTKDFKQI